MQRRTLGVLAALAALLPLTTQADTMDYSFVELGYVDTELDEADADGNGFALRGSLAFHESFFAFAAFQDTNFDGDRFRPDVDLTAAQVGIGARYPLGTKLDLVGRLGLMKAEVDAGRFDEDEDGFTLGARVRGELMPKLELEGGFEHYDVEDVLDDTVVVLEGRYFFLENFAGGLRIEFGDADTFGLDVRMTF